MLPNSSASFRFCRHFETVLLNTIVKLPCEVVLFNIILDKFYNFEYLSRITTVQSTVINGVLQIGYQESILLNAPTV